MTEREEFEKFWSQLADREMADIFKPVAFATFQIGRRSRQKQDAEICRSAIAAHCDCQKCMRSEACANAIEETP